MKLLQKSLQCFHVYISRVCHPHRFTAEPANEFIARTVGIDNVSDSANVCFQHVLVVSLVLVSDIVINLRSSRFESCFYIHTVCE